MKAQTQRHKRSFPMAAFVISVAWIFIIYGTTYWIHRATQNAARGREAESPRRTEMGRRNHGQAFRPAHEYERSFDWNVYLFEKDAPARP